jgi:hypothetical protein
LFLEHKYKIILLFFLLIAEGCSENEILTNQSSDLITFSENYTPRHFELTRMKVLDLFGEWRLINATLEYSKGTINKAENYFGFSENKKIMSFKTNELQKIIFWGNPEFINGSHQTFSADSVDSFCWTAAGNAPPKICDINYTNSVLTLKYSSETIIHNKWYSTYIYESYKKK